MRMAPSKMPAAKALVARRMRLALALLTLCLGADLGGCSDAAIVTTQVNLQKIAAEKSEVLATIPKGSTVKLSGCTNGWCFVSWDGREGYILAKYVRVGGAKPRAATDGSGTDGAEEDIPPGAESSEGFGPGD